MNVFDIGKDVWRIILKSFLSEGSFKRILLTSKKFHVLSDDELIDVYKKFASIRRYQLCPYEYVCTICHRNHKKPEINISKNARKKFMKKHRLHVKKYHDPLKIEDDLSKRKCCEICSVFLNPKSKSSLCDICTRFFMTIYNCKFNCCTKYQTYFPCVYLFQRVRKCYQECRSYVKCENCGKKVLRGYLDYHKGEKPSNARIMFPKKMVGYVSLKQATSDDDHLNNYVCTHELWDSKMGEEIKGTDFP